MSELALKGLPNEQLVLLYQIGIKDALGALLEQNTGIVFKIAMHYYTDSSSSIDKDDLMQEGMIGLMRAAEKYSFTNDKSAKFITYAIFWIKSKISRFITTKNTNEEVSLNTKVKDGQSDEIVDLIPIDEDGFEKVNRKLFTETLRVELDHLMKNELTLRQREIVKFRYGWDAKEMTLDDIAEIYSISRQRIRQIEIQSLESLRNSSWGRKFEKENRSAKKYNNYNTLIEEIDREFHLKKFDKIDDLFGDSINGI